MSNSFHIGQFVGLPVVDFHIGDKASGDGKVVYRLSQDFEDSEDPEGQRALLDALLQQVKPEALVIGHWNGAYESAPTGFLDGLVAHRLPSLRALFVGDIISEECEISWICQGDYTALVDAYPQLEGLCIRGGKDLSLPAAEYPGLRGLILQSGGLPTSVLDALTRSRFPRLDSLELWLGTQRYGFDGDLSTCTKLLEQIAPQRLQYLGLRNSEIADDLAIYLAQQDWLGRLDTLDLSMGTLSDRGAEALCASPHLQGLKVLDVRHHYMSPAFMDKLARLPLTLLINEPEEDYGYGPYVQVGE